MVSHKVLWAVVKERGIHPKLKSFIKDFYNGNRVQVAGHGVKPEWVSIRTGMRQGCTPSPLLSTSS